MMRPNADNNEFARRMLQRPVAPSLSAGEIWNDIPDKIGRAMGGREFFFEEEATSIHRIGIGLGLGWRLPKYKQRADGIDMISISYIGGLLSIAFLHCGERPSYEAELVKEIGGLQYADLRPTYEREMYGQA
jgi:hypothetical protein